MPPSRKPPPECPVCGADVPRDARACPECGADERTGWDEEATRYDGLDLPESAFGDDPSARPRPRHAARLWWAVAALLAALLVYLTLVAGF
jgi:predicted nucleic acid-binding Zn ribbon protein